MPCGKPVPVGGGGEILLHAESARQKLAEQRLRRRIALLGPLQSEGEGGEEKAALEGAIGVVGRYGRFLAGRRHALVDAAHDLGRRRAASAALPCRPARRAMHRAAAERRAAASAPLIGQSGGGSRHRRSIAGAGARAGRGATRDRRPAAPSAGARAQGGSSDSASRFMRRAVRVPANGVQGEPHGLARPARMRPDRIVKRDEGGARRGRFRHAVERASRHHDRRDLHQLRPPLGQIESFRMRRVVRVAVRASEEDVIDADLARLHGSVARMQIAGADDALRPERFHRGAEVARAGPDLHAVGLQPPGDARVVGDQRGGAGRLDDRHELCAEPVGRLLAVGHDQHRGNVAGGERLTRAQQERQPASAPRGVTRKRRVGSASSGMSRSCSAAGVRRSSEAAIPADFGSAQAAFRSRSAFHLPVAARPFIRARCEKAAWPARRSPACRPTPSAPPPAARARRRR